MGNKAKSRPKYQTERSGPSKDRREYVEKVANPKTPEDLVLALQNPATPAYKEMMNQMNAKLDNVAIIELLIQRHFIDHHLATEKEKNEIFREQLAQDLMNQQKETIRYHEQAVLASAAERKPVFDEPALKKEIEQQKITLNQLKEEVTALNTLLSALIIAGHSLDKDWGEKRTREKNDYHELLVRKEVSLYTASGTEIKPGTERYKAMLQASDQPATPDNKEGLVKKMDIIASSIVLDAAQKHLNENQGEGAPKLNMKEVVSSINTDELAEKVKKAENINDQILQFADPKFSELTGDKNEDIGHAILKVIRLNKEASKLKAEQLAQQKASPEASGQQQPDPAKEAIENRKQLILARAELHEKGQQINQTEAELAINEKRLDNLQAKTNAQNTIRKEEPDHPTKRK